MQEAYKYPQQYILVAAPFLLLKQGQGAPEAFRKGVLGLLSSALLPHNSEPIEIAPEKLPDIAELDSVLQSMALAAQTRSALFIWSYDDSLMRIEAALHNATAFFQSHSVPHLVCFLHPTQWRQLTPSTRMHRATENVYLIEAIGGAHVPMLVIQTRLTYTPEDKEVCNLYLKGEFVPPVAGQPRAPLRRRQREITVPFMLEEIRSTQIPPKKS